MTRMPMPRSADPDIRVIHQGDFAVGTAPDQRIDTLLGSCVAVCLHDPVARVGGMNHILLPHGMGDITGSSGHGVNAMEVLINAVIRAGGARDRLRAKVFGGGRMSDRLRNIGQMNIDFAHGFLRNEGITCVGGSIGGRQGRRVQFWPATGLVRQKYVAGEMVRSEPPAPAPQLNDVELF